MLVQTGEERLGHRRGLHHRQRSRDRQQGLGRRDHIFRIAAAGDQCADRLAHHLISGSAAKIDDRSRHLEPRDGGCGRRRRIEPAPLQHVRPIDARRHDLDQHLVVAGIGDRPPHGNEHLRTAGLRGVDRPHLVRHFRHRRPSPGLDGPPPFIDSARATVNAAAMDLDELFPDRPDDPLTLLTRQDLDPLSVDELNARILILEAEIARVKAKLQNAVNFRASAEGLFKKSRADRTNPPSCRT
jgi:uncharacterized small protein (DUF1192 family)